MLFQLQEKVEEKENSSRVSTTLSFLPFLLLCEILNEIQKTKSELNALGQADSLHYLFPAVRRSEKYSTQLKGED